MPKRHDPYLNLFMKIFKGVIKAQFWPENTAKKGENFFYFISFALNNVYKKKIQQLL